MNSETAKDSRIKGSEADLALAQKLADLSDAITLNRYLAHDLVVETKPDTTPVTDADREVERMIRQTLAKERSQDLIIGEEFGGVEKLESAETGSRFWIIDPIDGTKNFLRGMPTWATLIALAEVTAKGPQITVGVVSSPALGRRWFARTGGKAFVNESFSGLTRTREINVSKISRFDDASLSYSDLNGWKERKGAFVALFDSLWRTRAVGDFFSHMLVAEGAVDIAAEPTLALWDMAAVAIIVEEAGGRFTSLDGVAGPFGASGVSSNGFLHEKFLASVKAK
jgi:histidinol-phosphatase